MTVKHIEFENDAKALKALAEMLEQGIVAHISRSFGHGPAIIVQVTPDDTETPTVPVTTAEADTANPESEE